MNQQWLQAAQAVLLSHALEAQPPSYRMLHQPTVRCLAQIPLPTCGNFAKPKSLQDFFAPCHVCTHKQPAPSTLVLVYETPSLKP